MGDAFWPAAGLFLMYGTALFVYFLPWMHAKGRKHHQTTAIGMLNLLLGWTVLGWITALIWASTAVEKRAAK